MKENYWLLIKNNKGRLAELFLTVFYFFVATIQDGGAGFFKCYTYGDGPYYYRNSS